MRTMTWRRLIPALLLALLVTATGLALTGGAARAADCVVTNTNDSGTGSLREKMGNGACGAITFQAGVSGTIVLSDSLPEVARPISVTGPSDTSITIDRQDAISGHIFYVVSGGEITLRDLTLTGAALAVRGDYANTITLDRVTLTGNRFGIFLRYSGTVHVRNSTFSGNWSSGMSLNYSPGPTATVINSTFGGNLYAIDPPGAGTTVTNSLFAKQTYPNCPRGGLIDGGHNLADDSSCFAGGANGSKVVAAGQTGIAALGNYGGPTATHALLPGSPAIDAGDTDACTDAPVSGADQRGVVRPQPSGGACDIGAFESRGFTLSRGGGNNQSTASGTAFASPLVATVSSGFGEPVAGGRVTFTGPVGGAGIADSPGTATIAADGRASFAATANTTTGGPYTVTARAAGAAAEASYTLTNVIGPTTLAVDASGTYGGTATMRATLTATNGGAGIAGRVIVFKLNGTPVGQATTDGQGTATLAGVPLPPGLSAGNYPGAACASFAGGAGADPSGPTCGPLRVAKRILWLKPKDRTRAAAAANPTCTTVADLELVAPAPAGTGLINGDTLAGAVGIGPGASCTYGVTGGTPARPSKPGGYTIIFSGATSANYDLRYKTGTLTVTP